MKILKTYNQVSIVEVDYSKEYLTKRGFHLNDTGKYKFSEHLFSPILSVPHKMKVIPVYLDWNKGNDYLYSTVTGGEI